MDANPKAVICDFASQTIERITPELQIAALP